MCGESRKHGSEGGGWKRTLGNSPAAYPTTWRAGRPSTSLRGQQRFGDGGRSAPFPSAIAIWGRSPEMLADLDAALSGAWRVR